MSEQEAIHITPDDDPGAATLEGISASLRAIAAGQTGGASSAALIARGAALIKSLRPTTHLEWAAQAGASARFWAAAARFQPHLVEVERRAREELKAKRVFIRQGAGKTRVTR